MEKWRRAMSVRTRCDDVKTAHWRRATVSLPRGIEYMSLISALQRHPSAWWALAMALVAGLVLAGMVTALLSMAPLVWTADRVMGRSSRG